MQPVTWQRWPLSEWRRSARRGALFAVLSVGCVEAKRVSPDPVEAVPPLDPHYYDSLPAPQRATYDGADAVVVATLVNPKLHGVLTSLPPIYMHGFEIGFVRPLGGSDFPAVRLSYMTRRPDHDRPFVPWSRAILSLRIVEQTIEFGDAKPGLTVEVARVDAATPELEQALAIALSPAPPDLHLSVTQVPSAPVGFENPFGDGVFDLSVVNRGKVRRVVPRLFVEETPSGDVVRFDEALEIRRGDMLPDFSAGTTLHLPTRPHIGPVRPLELAPSESVSIRVDVKPLHGLPASVGGGRLYYSFAIGPLRTSSFFYYSARLHGPLMGKTP